MSTVKTFGHFLYESGARGSKGRYNPDSKITPASPLVDGWERGTFNPDAVTFKDRYGFSLQETNGSPVGEGVGLSGALADAIHELSNPFMIVDNQHYTVATYWDLCDARYVMAGEQTAYAALVEPILRRLNVSVSQPNFPPSLPPVITVDPNPQPIDPNPPVDPCASVKAQLANATGEIALLQHSLTATNNQREAQSGLLLDLEDIIRALKFPAGNTGGVAWVALRKIRKALGG